MSRQELGEDRVVNHKKSLKQWILPLVILFLTLSSVLLITINKTQTEERLAALGRETVKINVNDEMVAQFDLDVVKALPKVLADEGLNTSKGKEEIVFGGVLLKDGVYLVYERNGVENTDKTQGGTGPMEIVITGETFSLRNCKYLSEIYFE